MKLVLAIFGLMMVLTFGTITAVDSYTPAHAGRTGDSTDVNVDCHDDGDDDLPGNEEPVDDPDSEDNDEEQVPGERNDEPADPEDHDPSYEEDDDVNCDLGPTGIFGETQTPLPSPTPCVTFNPVSAQGEECCDLVPTDVGAALLDPCCFITFGEIGGQLLPPECCGIFGGGEVGAEGPGSCCIFYPFLPGCCPDFNSFDVGSEGPGICCLFDVDGGVGAEGDLCCLPFTETDVGAEGPGICCFSAGGDEVNVEGGFPCLDGLAADVDCDGDVTAADAYSSLAALGGVTAEGSGCEAGGDVDCSGVVDPLDTLAILKILAGFAEPAAC